MKFKFPVAKPLVALAPLPVQVKLAPVLVAIMMFELPLIQILGAALLIVKEGKAFTVITLDPVWEAPHPVAIA